MQGTVNALPPAVTLLTHAALLWFTSNASGYCSTEVGITAGNRGAQQVLEQTGCGLPCVLYQLARPGLPPVAASIRAHTHTRLPTPRPVAERAADEAAHGRRGVGPRVRPTPACGAAAAERAVGADPRRGGNGR